MRNLPLSAGMAGIAIALGLTAAPAAKAYNVDTANGAACQLSIPTTNTGVRPKASGFRNESKSASNFVICTLQNSSTTGNYAYVNLVAYSLDGLPHDITCTAVTGVLAGGNTLMYSSKTATFSDTTGSDLPFTWSAADFGGTEGAAIPSSWNFSVTCNLKPQTAISYIFARTP